MSSVGSTGSLYELETLFLEKLQEKYKLNIRDIKRAFSRFDLDHNGLLDLGELVKGFQLFLNGVKESQVRELVSRYDVNGDGKVSYEEFLQFLSNRSAVDPYEDGASMSEAYDDGHSDLGSRPSSAGGYGQRRPATGPPARGGGGGGRRGAGGGGGGYADSDLGFSPRVEQYSDRGSSNAYAPQGRSISVGRGGGDRGGGRREAWEAEPPVQQPPQGRGGGGRGGGEHYYNDRASVISDLIPPSTAGSTNVPSELNDANPRELENRAKTFIVNMKNFLIKKASEMRLSGKVKMPVTMTMPEMQESVARGILSKAFQPYTGTGDGRVKSRGAEGVEFPDFAKVLRSFQFPGTSPLRTETIQYLFDICSTTDDGLIENEEGRVVANADHLIDLIFGRKAAIQHGIGPTTGVPTGTANAPLGALKNNWVKEAAADVPDGVVDPVSGRVLTNFVSKVNAGRNTVGVGPVRIPDATDAKKERLQELLAVPLRFVSRKSRTALAVPSNFDPNSAIPRSNSLPSYELVRNHVFGISTTRYSGNMLYSLPTPPTAFHDLRLQRQPLPDHGRPQSARTNPDYIDNATLVYASAALGIIHGLSINRQVFLNGHKDDITCITVSPDSSMIATGCMGKESVIHVYDAVNHGELITTIGKGFFQRGVCSLEFSYDNRLIITISCDDNHMMALFNLQTGEKVIETSCQHGIPPQIRWIAYCPAQQHTEYITREHAGLCDLFVTAGEHHLRLWSFRRSSNSDPNPSLQYKGMTMGSKSTVTAAKCYTCAAFSYCEDKSYDLIAGGSNGMVYLWRKGTLTAHSQAMKGKIQVMVVYADKVYCGGMGGVVRVLDARTLTAYRQYNLCGDPNPITPKPSSSGGSGVSGGVGRPRSASAGPAGRRPSSASASAVTARAREVKPTHAAGVPLQRSNNPPFGSDHNHAGDTAISPGDEERGVKNVLGLTVIPGPSGSRNPSQGLYLIAALGTGKMIRIDIGNITGPIDTPRGSRPLPNGNDIYGKDLLYYHIGPVYGLAADVTSSKRLCATVGDDKQLMVWDAQDRVLIAKTALKNPSRCCHIDKTNSFIAVGCTSGTVTIYFLTDFPHINTLTNKPDPYYRLDEIAFRKDCKSECTTMKFSPNNLFLAVGCRDDCIYIYSTSISLSETGSGRDIHSVGSCSLRAMHRLKGHSSTITHLDWSYDSMLLQSTCAAYELLCWDVEAGKLNTSINVADVRWKTQHCVLGFNVMGIWPPYSDGTDINAVDACKERGIVVTGNDDQGLVRLMNYPCIVKNAPAKEYSGHSSHVTCIRMMRGGETVMTTGGNDGSVMLMDVVPDRVDPDGFR